jgi:hypothetical protein
MFGIFDDEDEEQPAAPAAADPIAGFRSEKPLDPTVRAALEQKFFAKPDLSAAKERASGNRRTASVVEGLGRMLGGKVDGGFFDGMRARADGQVAQAEKEAGRDKDVYRYLIDRDDKLKTLSASAEQAKAMRASREKLAADKIAADKLEAEAKRKFEGDEGAKKRWLEQKLAEAKLKQEAELKAADLAAQGSRTAAELEAKGKQVPASKMVASETAKDIGGFDGAMKLAEQLEGNWRDKAGSWHSGVTQYLPATDAKSYDDGLKMTAQTIGQILEGGKLTDADYARYVSMMPTAGDSEERAAEKFRLLKQQILEKKRGSIAGAKQAGYDTSGFASVPETAPAPDLTKPDSGTAIGAPERKTVNGVTYEKVNGGWKRVR